MKEHINHIIDTIHQKVIVDTVRMPSKDSIDLLSKLDTFYNNAWTKLLFLVTVALTIVGILVPILIQWYQKRELKLSEDKLSADIKAELTKAISDTQKSIKDEADLQLNVVKAGVKGLGNFLQASMFYSQNFYPLSVTQSLYAAKHYLKADDYHNASQSLLLLKLAIIKCSKESIDSIFLKEETSFSKEIIKLQENDKRNILRAEILDAEKMYKELLK